jgi:hypothetical protein
MPEKAISLKECLAAVRLERDGKPIEGKPAEGVVFVRRAAGPMILPIQFILRELQSGFPKATFVFKKG